MKSNSKPNPGSPAASSTPTNSAKPSATISDEAELLAWSQKEPKVLHAIHWQFGGNVLRSQYESFKGRNTYSETAVAFAKDVGDRMDARDPLERMLIDQMLWTHVRIGRLSSIAMQQEGLKQLQTVNDAADKAMNTFRRQMLALREYRDPKPPPSFTAIAQQNIALVNNSKDQNSQNKTVTNEKENSDAPQQTKALPADTGSVSLPAQFHPAREAVAVGNRAEDAGRQGAQQHERL